MCLFFICKCLFLFAVCCQLQVVYPQNGHNQTEHIFHAPSLRIHGLLKRVAVSALGKSERAYFVMDICANEPVDEK